MTRYLVTDTVTKSLAATAIIMLALAACGTATQDNKRRGQRQR